MESRANFRNAHKPLKVYEIHINRMLIKYNSYRKKSNRSHPPLEDLELNLRFLIDF